MIRVLKNKKRVRACFIKSNIKNVSILLLSYDIYKIKNNNT